MAAEAPHEEYARYKWVVIGGLQKTATIGNLQCPTVCWLSASAPVRRYLGLAPTFASTRPGTMLISIKVHR